MRYSESHFPSLSEDFFIYKVKHDPSLLTNLFTEETFIESYHGQSLSVYTWMTQFFSLKFSQFRNIGTQKKTILYGSVITFIKWKYTRSHRIPEVGWPGTTEKAFWVNDVWVSLKKRWQRLAKWRELGQRMEEDCNWREQQSNLINIYWYTSYVKYGLKARNRVEK